jgi:hypothetical protein
MSGSAIFAAFITRSALGKKQHKSYDRDAREEQSCEDAE